MLLSSLLLIPLLGIFIISSFDSYHLESKVKSKFFWKKIALIVTIVNFFISLVIFTLFDFSVHQFQFVGNVPLIPYGIYLGVDAVSIYFLILTTFIFPIVIISSWNSIIVNNKSFLVIILLLESLLLGAFLVLDLFLFYIFFEAILPPLFILLGLFGSGGKVRASFYLFIYTLFGSLFLLLAILAISSIIGTTDFEVLWKSNFDYYTQIILFFFVFLAISIKTPLYFVHTWLLKAHTEAPLGGSIILAAIVLKLGLYGVIRIILPILPEASMCLTPAVFVIGVITIIYASFSTLRTTDIKEIIAYSSVSHAAVYLMGAFSNTIQGLEGSIVLGLAHGLVSPALFIIVGGVFYERSGTRSIHYYRGIAQIMPMCSILFFILCLGNCGAPLTLNFVGEFLSLYGVFEKLPMLGVLASSSIVFSAAYTIYLFNRISFGGSFSLFFQENWKDLTKREFFILLILVILAVLFGIYPSFILDGLHMNVSALIYAFNK